MEKTPDSVVQGSPAHVDQLRDQSQVEAREGRHSQALTLLRQAEAADPENPDIQVDMAIALFELQDFWGAQMRLSKVIARQPSFAECLFLHALCHQRLGNTPEAIAGLKPLTAGRLAATLQARAPKMANAVSDLLTQLQREMTSTHSVPQDGRLIALQADPAHPRWSASGAAKYDLSHLNQLGHQRVVGPVQDDEALLLYATVRVMRMRRILEVGGLAGYSARNFLQAMQGDAHIAMYTVDVNPVPSLAPEHHVIVRDCGELQPEDVHGAALDMVFLDAHVVEPQLRLIQRLEAHQLLHRHSVIALHDTNLHRVTNDDVTALTDSDGEIGWPHQKAERQIVNALHQAGWQALNFHMPLARSDDLLGYRHGLTLMRRFSHLRT
jgi:predicted O-methyltransferase YrrM